MCNAAIPGPQQSDPSFPYMCFNKANVKVTVADYNVLGPKKLEIVSPCASGGWALSPGGDYCYLQFIAACLDEDGHGGAIDCYFMSAQDDCMFATRWECILVLWLTRLLPRRRVASSHRMGRYAKQHQHLVRQQVRAVAGSTLPVHLPRISLSNTTQFRYTCSHLHLRPEPS